ncbi:BED-type domain-containing protein [Aphelenchoides besseyi]|nr:BED-type domain-containing protein [Aphelenchoides besseyi]
MPSVVWEFFTKTAAGPKCVLCNDLRRRRDSSTKTMWVHLKLKHLDIYRRLRNPDSCRNPVATKSSEVSNRSVFALYVLLIYGKR